MTANIKKPLGIKSKTDPKNKIKAVVSVVYLGTEFKTNPKNKINAVYLYFAF